MGRPYPALQGAPCGLKLPLAGPFQSFEDKWLKHRTQLSPMSKQAKEAIGVDELEVVADRGYYKGEEILACDEAGVTTYLPKPQTSGNWAKGLFSKRDFIYIAEDGEYQCPAGELLIWRFQAEENGLTVHKYWSSACPRCAIKSQCTPSPYRRVTRWEHEAVLEAVEARLDKEPERMRVRRQTAEHPFGTLKAWMGHTHFQMKTLKHVRTEMSLHVLAYNLKRAINILGAKPLIAAIQASKPVFSPEYARTQRTRAVLAARLSTAPSTHRYHRLRNFVARWLRERF